MRWLRDLIQGQLLPDLKDAAAAGISLGYVGGYLSGAVVSALGEAYEADKPVTPREWAADGAACLAILGVTIVLPGRMFLA